mgnify:CR=1 FL=1
MKRGDKIRLNANPLPTSSISVSEFSCSLRSKITEHFAGTAVQLAAPSLS